MLPKSNIMLLDRIGPKSMVPLSELNKFLEKGVITRRAIHYKVVTYQYDFRY